MAAKKSKRGPTKQSAFLAAFAKCGRVSPAARAAKIERENHYRWLREDPDYPALFAAAEVMAVQVWEDEAVRRAVEGVFEPTVYKGEFTFPVIGYEKDPETGEDRIVSGRRVPIFGKRPFGVVKHSDRLLEFLLRGGKPDKYRDRGTVELTGANGGPVELVARLSAARERLQRPAAVDPPAVVPEASAE